MTALRVFIVDDDRDLAAGIADVLEYQGHQAILAFTGEEAIGLLPELTFDVAFDRCRSWLGDDAAGSSPRMRALFLGTRPLRKRRSRPQRGLWHGQAIRWPHVRRQRVGSRHNS